MERIELHNRIKSLLKRHHLLTVATSADGVPWCASCFFSWDISLCAFIITTDPATRHGSEFRGNPRVAGTIALETKRVGRIRGLQFTGVVSEPSGDDLKAARRSYLRRFPYAALADLHLWIIKPDFMKLTDNRLGFGKKITWNRH